jgi:predicted membrane protein
MSSRRERRKKKFILIFISCIVFGIGYLFLNVISGIFEVPLGITFHVIFGCTLMAISGIYIGYTIKQLYFTKKRKRSKRIYLDDKIDKKSN